MGCDDTNNAALGQKKHLASMEKHRMLSPSETFNYRHQRHYRRTHRVRR